MKNFFKTVRLDISRYGDSWYCHPGFWVVLSYRTRKLRKNSSTFIKFGLLPIDITFAIIRCCFSSVRLPSSVEIGPGLYLAHPDGLIINSMCLIGARVSLFQQVTLGEWKGRAPKLEDGVAVFAGAKIFGGVVIGADSKIGANTVVNFDVPKMSTVALAKSAVVTISREN